MKVTVGAIRQIVREEAERLNENEEAKAEAEAEAMTDTDVLVWAKTEMMELLKPLANRWNDDLKNGIIDIINTLDANPAAGKRALNFTDKLAGQAVGESVDRDELRNLIMAEAAELVQD